MMVGHLFSQNANLREKEDKNYTLLITMIKGLYTKNRLLTQKKLERHDNIGEGGGDSE